MNFNKVDTFQTTAGARPANVHVAVETLVNATARTGSEYTSDRKTLLLAESSEATFIGASFLITSRNDGKLLRQKLEAGDKLTFFVLSASSPDLAATAKSFKQLPEVLLGEITSTMRGLAQPRSPSRRKRARI